jgi:hypothetical protein
MLANVSHLQGRRFSFYWRKMMATKMGEKRRKEIWKNDTLQVGRTNKWWFRALILVHFNLTNYAQRWQKNLLLNTFLNLFNYLCNNHHFKMKRKKDDPFQYLIVNLELSLFFKKTLSLIFSFFLWYLTSGERV